MWILFFLLLWRIGLKGLLILKLYEYLFIFFEICCGLNLNKIVFFSMDNLYFGGFKILIDDLNEFLMDLKIKVDFDNLFIRMIVLIELINSKWFIWLVILWIDFLKRFWIICNGNFIFLCLIWILGYFVDFFNFFLYLGIFCRYFGRVIIKNFLFVFLLVFFFFVLKFCCNFMFLLGCVWKYFLNLFFILLKKIWLSNI